MCIKRNIDEDEDTHQGRPYCLNRYETSGPVRFGELRHGCRLSRWIDQNYRTVLPLEHERSSIDIFTFIVELHISLDTLESIAGVQLIDKRHIIDAVNLVHRLGQNL